MNTSTFTEFKDWDIVLKTKYTSKYLKYWLKKRYLVIFILALIGFVYQGCTLGLMFANDIITQNDIRLWNGYFPWWTIFFTFTFWSNFFVFISYFLYLFFFPKTKLKNNNIFLLISSCYITVVLIIVACALFPAAVIEKNNVNFGSKTNPITLGALIMPHAPGPIYMIFFSLTVCSLNRKGNWIINKNGYWLVLIYVLIFFLSYMIMDIILNWIPIGAYYINEHNEIVKFSGYSVYSRFTAINPDLPIVSAGKVSGHGSYINILFYFLAVAILIIVYTIAYWIIKKRFLFDYKITKIYKIEK